MARAKADRSDEEIYADFLRKREADLEAMGEDFNAPGAETGVGFEPLGDEPGFEPANTGDAA